MIMGALVRARSASARPFGMMWECMSIVIVMACLGRRAVLSVERVEGIGVGSRAQ
jgi:hypothetical protein